jgi:hypothetical protein
VAALPEEWLRTAALGGQERWGTQGQHSRRAAARNRSAPALGKLAAAKEGTVQRGPAQQSGHQR